MINNSDYTQPLHNLLGRKIDVSLICSLFYSGDNTVIINGYEVANFVEYKVYRELEKHFIQYKKSKR